MAVYRLTGAAEADIVEILAWSEVQFGPAARLRYERLIVTALVDIASDPVRPGSLARPELGTDVRSWHLRSSRDRAKGPDGGVQRPRHFLILSPKTRRPKPKTARAGHTEAPRFRNIDRVTATPSPRPSSPRP